MENKNINENINTIVTKENTKRNSRSKNDRAVILSVQTESGEEKITLSKSVRKVSNRNNRHESKASLREFLVWGFVNE